MDDGNRKAEAIPRTSVADDSPGIRLFAPGTSLASRFEIGAVRGVGGSAVVYSAFDRELKQTVALKVLRADRTTPAALVRMKREVAIARQAASPRLVRVFDIDATGESVFLSMEDVEGGSLKDRLAEGRVPLEEALRVAAEILEGLAVLHGLGIVHRDVKPGNVLLAVDGAVKLADFGLARRLEIDETRATSMDAVVGTVEYLSPEQALGHELDGRSDLYSFGVTLFEMLSGGVPFRRDSAISTALAHVRDPAPRLRSVRPDVPAWIDAFVARLLSKDPAERHATAEAALADLKARHATAAARPGRRRAAAAALVALAAVGGAAALFGPRLLAPRLPVRIASRMTGGHGIVALDARSRPLWERRDVWAGAHAALFRDAERKPGIAAIRTRDGNLAGASAPLDFLSPATGETLRTMDVALPAVGLGWDAGTEWSVLSLDPVDVDGSGGEELVLILTDVGSYPSAAILVDPASRTAKLVFAGNGHHAFLGVADVDGDGRKEFLLAGSANLLGQYVGVAAVRVAGTPVGPGETRQGQAAPATTPGHRAYGLGRSALAWYALGPPFRVTGQRSAHVDETGRSVRFEGLSRSPFTLGFDGFRTDVPSGLDGPARAAARQETWELLAKAARLADANDYPGAVSASEEAVREIGPAGDPSLLEWTKRTQARLLVGAGEAEKGETLLREVLAGTDGAVPVALDAARALHLSGEVTRSTRWYERAVFGNGTAAEGWMIQAALENAVLALLELRRGDDALALVERAGVAYSVKSELRDLVAWRSGRRMTLRPESNYATPLRRYWLLEERLAAGTEAGEKVLVEAASARETAGEARELFALLEAELLLRSGKAREAWDRAGSAFAALWARRTRDVEARAHLDLAADRAGRSAEAVGRRAEAAKIRSDARRFLAAAR